jgi:hypothetical protein
VALAVVALGVLWSNALAYREVNLAPRDQLAELERIGEDFAGAGPALMTEYQPYGVRYFLRKLDAEGASELRRRPVLLKDGTMLPKGGYADLSAFRPADLLVYRTLVLRRSPLESRPPAAYRLVRSGRFYEVWQRGKTISAGAAMPCAERPAVYGVPEGAAPVSVTVPRSGRYEVWVGGSFRGRVTTVVDGQELGSREHRLGWAGQFVSLGQVSLAGGRHEVLLRRTSPRLRPGTGGAQLPLGPLVLSPLGRCGTGA